MRTKPMTLPQLVKELQSQPELARNRPVICELQCKGQTLVYEITSVDLDDGMTVLAIQECHL